MGTQTIAIAQTPIRTTTIYDDATGEIDLTYTTHHSPPLFYNVLVAVTDNDLSPQWLSVKIWMIWLGANCGGVGDDLGSSN